MNEYVYELWTFNLSRRTTLKEYGRRAASIVGAESEEKYLLIQKIQNLFPRENISTEILEINGREIQNFKVKVRNEKRARKMLLKTVIHPAEDVIGIFSTGFNMPFEWKIPIVYVS